MDMPFEGIPTVPPPKDRDRVAFFAGGCRYLVSAKPADTVADVKRRLFDGGIARAYPPGEVAKAEDLELYYACVRMDEPGARLEDYRVPAVRVVTKLHRGAGAGARPSRSRYPPATPLHPTRTGLQDHDRAVDGAHDARAAAQGERVLAVKQVGRGALARSPLSLATPTPARRRALSPSSSSAPSLDVDSEL